MAHDRAAQKKAREEKRLERKQRIARMRMQEFEDQLSDTELALLRLDSLPEELQEDNHAEARDMAEKNIKRINLSLDVMMDEVGDEPEDEEAQKAALAAANPPGKPPRRKPGR